MIIVIKKVGQQPEVKEIEGELHEMQDIVGGYLECIGFVDNILCVLNEEGKLKELEPNFICNNDIIVGNVFFCNAGEEDFESLNDEQIQLIMNIFELKKN